MTYGVTIDGTDTQTQYGLILLNDVSVASPQLREERITVPGRDGTLNMSYALTGEPVYNDRTITFTLFKQVDDTALETLRQSLITAYHGKECYVAFPFDSTYRYRGVVQIGNRSGFNSGKIPVTVTAEPWRLKTTQTTVNRNLDTTELSITLSNAQMPVTPTITVDTETTLVIDGNTRVVSAGTWSGLLRLVSGTKTIKASTTEGTGTITITYTEGIL